VAPGSTIEVTLTADADHTFGGSSTKVLSGTFNAAESPCGSVEAPQVCPDGTDRAGQLIPDGQTIEAFCDIPGSGQVAGPTAPKAAVSAPAAVTPTVVHAGLGDAFDMRGQEGLALVFAGMLLLLAAGGLGLVRPAGGARH
jgi:hypothetical protein